MIKINKKNYKKFQVYEQWLRTAHYGSYVMGISQLKITQLVELARSAGYTGSLVSSCNSCLIKFLREVAKPYFEYQKTLNKDEK